MSMATDSALSLVSRAMVKENATKNKERLTTSVFGPGCMQSVNHTACSGIWYPRNPQQNWPKKSKAGSSSWFQAEAPSYWWICAPGSESSGRIFGFHAGNGSAVGQCPSSRRLQEWGEVIFLVFGGFANMLDGVKQFMDTLGWQNQAFILLRNIKLSTFLLQLQLTMDGQAWAKIKLMLDRGS